ncbi:MAG: single-stranded-DNA-specific exonuclease RecJ [Rhodocyclaceae bacterium]|nr:single-stranded-DNA-specific exonuclease RecJ [Rhodocyclaceae bacterium]MBP7081110.1 single-stranded-DNA-specific exonuclease RecJ [Rhodocyclaceae bacterium]
MTHLTIRKSPPRAAWALEQAGVHPLLARLYAARGITDALLLDTRTARLLAPELMKNSGAAAVMLADAIADEKKLLIVADYDCDGATACAVGLRALRMMGARVDYLVPDRFTLGYGLSPEVVQLAANSSRLGKPDIIITVDNGIASIDGVNEATRLGIRTLITDHHLPAAELPQAEVIVNPNQPGCNFPSKCIAGVGVMFYVMLALRAELRQRGVFSNQAEPNLAALLDLVALGTVADVVALDYNNRILVAQGLNRMRANQMQAGIAALFQITGREPRRAATFDLGFTLGPRLNAAGRLADMSLGIEALITDDMSRALNIAQELDTKNRERRSIEAGMKDDAELLLDAIDVGNRASLTLFDPTWHQGVIGILAGRVKEKFHRPTFAFARGNKDELKASGRSIPGLHLRDALDLVAKRQPMLLIRFGGHAAAAGLTLKESDLADFEASFESVCRELIHPTQLTRTLETDGPLESGYYSVDTARLIQKEIWGQTFPPPIFDDSFQVVNQRILKEKHLKLKLKKGDRSFDAIQFNCADTAPDKIRAAFRLDINEWNGTETVQLTLEHFEPA